MKNRKDLRRGRPASESALAAMLHEYGKRLTRLERSNQMSRGSVLDGPLHVYDGDETLTMEVGAQYDGSFVANPLVGPEPPIPTPPVLTPGLRSVTVHWDGTFEPLYAADGVTVIDDLVVAPMDFARVEIHASTDPLFDATSVATLVGTCETPRGGDQIIPVPTSGEDYTVKLVCRTLPGKRGDASAGTTVAAEDVATSDGLPPASSPTPIAIGQVGGVYLAWDPVDNPDPVTYRVYLSDSSTVPATPDNRAADVSATAFLIPEIAAPYDHETYFRIVAYDADGDAPPGGVTSGRSKRVAAEDMNDGVITLLKLAPDAHGAIVDAASDAALAAAAAAAAQADAAAAIAGAADAQATADGKASTYFQTSAPTGLGPGDVGDLWFDIDDGNKVRRWNGSSWVLAQDQSLADSVKAYVQSRSTNLVTNGTGALLDNTNFSTFTFNRADAPPGAGGSFVTPNAAGPFLADEYLPVDASKPFRLDLAARETGSAQGYNYAFLQPFDAYRLSIAPQHYMYIPGTTTTLAAPLSPGATTITVTSAANWFGSSGKPAGSATHQRSIIFWDYTDGGGKTWAPETYSRNWSGFDTWADGGITGNVITLRAPYSGPARPAGTPVSNGTSGGTYMYMTGLANVQVPGIWTKYAATISGIVATQGPNGTVASFATGWPQGVAFARLGFIANAGLNAVGATVGARLAVASLSFSDAAAAANLAASKITTFYQTATPVSLAIGDLWVKTNDGNRLYRAASAGANSVGPGQWVDARDTAIATASAAASAAQAAATSALTAAQAAQATADGAIRTYYVPDPPWPDGSTQPEASLGDLWFDTNDGQAYRWNGSAWQIIEDSSIAAALAAAQDAQITADGKISTYFSTERPWADGAAGHASDTGDLWYDTNDGNKAYYWTGTAWEALPVGLSGLGTDVTARNLGAITTTVSATAPASPKTGDLWMDSANGNVLKRWSGSAWVAVQDTAIQNAITAATNAANLADAKMRIFYEAKHASGMYPASNPVMGASDGGDLWFRTDEGNRPYRWTGTIWSAFSFAGSATAPTDGIVPSSSPTPTVIPGIACVFLRWTAITNRDPVSYRVYGSRTSGFTPSLSNYIGETSGTMMTVSALPAEPGVSIAPNIEHTTPAYFKIISADGDGPSGVISGQASGMGRQADGDDVGFNSVTADHLAAKSVVGTSFSGSIMMGSTITTGSLDEDEDSPTYGQILGQSITMGPDGFFVRDSTGTPFISFPMNVNEDAIIKSGLVTNNLVVLGGASIGGVGNEIARGATLMLANSISAPAEPPSVRVSYDRFQFRRITASPNDPGAGNLGSFALDYSQILTVEWSAGGSHWVVVQKRSNGVRFWRYTADGQNLVSLISEPTVKWVDDLVGWSDVTSVITYPHTYWSGHYGKYNGEWYISALQNTASDIANGTHPSGVAAINEAPALEVSHLKPVAFYDEFNKYVGVVETHVANSGGRSVKVRYYTMTGALGGAPFYRSMTQTANSGTSINAQLCSMLRVNAPGLGGTRYVWSWRNNAAWLIGVSNMGGSPMVATERWPVAAAAIAFTRDATNFWSLAPDGYMYKYTDWTWTDTLDYGHAALSWYDSDTAGTPTTGPDGRHETPLGTISTIFLPKRGRLIVDPPLPPDKGGVDDPDRWRLYMVKSGIAQPGSSSFRFQTEGSTASSIALTAIGTGGAAPAPIPFPDASPATMFAAKASHVAVTGRKSFQIDGNGLGHWDRLVPPGAIMEFGGNTPPSGFALPEITPGWLVCRGDIVSRTAYPALFAVVGTTFNKGGEAGTDFRLPDFQRRFPWGSHASTAPPGASDNVADPAQRSPTHSHSIANAGINVATNTATGGSAPRLTNGDTHNHGGSTGQSMWVSAGATDAPNTFPNLAVNFIIKY